MRKLIHKLLLTLPILLLAGCGSNSGGSKGSTTQTTPTASDSISISQGTLDQAFDVGTYAYAANVGNDVTSITVTTTAVETGAVITVNAQTVTSAQPSAAIPLNVGGNTITVVITAADGLSSRTYTFTVTRAYGVADLSGLSLSSVALSPAFSTSTLSYSATVSSLTASVDVTANLGDNTATMTINGAAASSGVAKTVSLTGATTPIDVVVTAADGVTTKTYSITVTRPAATDATLSALTMSGGALSPAFVSGTTNYTVTVNVSSVTVTPTLSDAAASVKVNSVAVASGSPSAAINLNLGSSNVINVVVTAADGVTTNTYTITVTRLNSDATLSALTPSIGALNPVFSANTTTYNVTVANADSNITLTATASDANISALTINGIAATSGVASGAIALSVGDNPINVVVTAEDGTTTKTYTVTVTRVSGDSSLAGLQVSLGSLDQTFQTASTSYTMTVGYLASSIQVTPTLSDATATMTVNGQSVTNATASQPISLTAGAATGVNVLVTAQDGVSTTTYTVNVTRQAATAFAQQAYLKASNTIAGDEFGNAVALSGDTLAVGAPLEDSGATGIGGNQVDDCASGAGALNCATDSGAVYVFTRSGGVWSQQAYIKAPDTDANDLFGYSLALEGDTLVVGAPQEDSNGTGVTNAVDFGTATWSNTLAGGSGAVYVYTRSGTTWSHEAFIKASNTDGGDNFGNTVAISGNWLAASAIYEDSCSASTPAQNDLTNCQSTGAVYTYQRNGVTWAVNEYLKATNIGATGSKGDQFGLGLSIDSTTLVASAPFEDGSGTGISPASDDAAIDTGAIYVFTYNGTTWGTGTYIKAAVLSNYDQFGHDVDILGDTIAVGAPREGSATGDPANNAAFASGAAYVFTRTAGVWSQQAYLKPTVIEGNDFFGMQVELGNGFLVVGAPGEDSAAITIDGNANDNTALSSGAAYVFTGSGASWVQDKYIKVTNTTAGDELGGSLVVNNHASTRMAVDGDSIAIGANLEDGSGVGINPTSDDAATSAGAAYILR